MLTPRNLLQITDLLFVCLDLGTAQSPTVDFPHGRFGLPSHGTANCHRVGLAGLYCFTLWSNFNIILTDGGFSLIQYLPERLMHTFQRTVIRFNTFLIAWQYDIRTRRQFRLADLGI